MTQRKIVDIGESLGRALTIFRAEHPEFQNDREALEAMLIITQKGDTSGNVPPVGGTEVESLARISPPIGVSNAGEVQQSTNIRRERIRLDSGEEYYPCELGAFEVDCLEVIPEIKLRKTQPSRCPVINAFPEINPTTLMNENCKKSKATERCPILQNFERWQVMETSTRMKVLLNREHLDFKREQAGMRQRELDRQKALPPPPRNSQPARYWEIQK